MTQFEKSKQEVVTFVRNELNSGYYETPKTLADFLYERKIHFYEENGFHYETILEWVRETIDESRTTKKETIVVKSEEVAIYMKDALEKTGIKNVKIIKGKKQFNPLLETQEWQEYIVSFYGPNK
jgi:hypothetical protein